MKYLILLSLVVSFYVSKASAIEILVSKQKADVYGTTVFNDPRVIINNQDTPISVRTNGNLICINLGFKRMLNRELYPSMIPGWPKAFDVVAIIPSNSFPVLVYKSGFDDPRVLAYKSITCTQF